ncbi:glycosyltransferase [Nakamurella sp.]|uniref:glycosyltransferase n=1 Tax=Nakamurella sp. TaxID=1869182 RepID=UPI003B3B59F7
MRRGAVPPAGPVVRTLPDPDLVRRALAGRVRAVGTVLLDELPAPAGSPESDTAAVLSAIADQLHAHPTNDRVWLVLAGLAAAFPTRDEVDRTRRRIELADPEQTAIALLEDAMAAVGTAGTPLARVSVAVGRVVVDVDFTARHDLHTGIQRVVRQTVPLWHTEHDILPVAWTNARGAMRPLDEVEAARIFAWTADRTTHGGADEPDRVADTDDHVVLPWRSVVVLPEVPQVDVTPRIAAIGACSNNRLVLVGHDAIPLLSAETLELEEPEKFMTFLSAVKFADRIAGVSRSSAAEFASFASMLSAQGLTGPTVTAVPLPVEFAVQDAPDTAPAGDTSAGPGIRATDPGAPRLPSSGTLTDGVPDVVVVGSHDPRKNHLAILHAAEVLWQRGVRFRLSFVGSPGSNEQFLVRVRRLQHRGRTVGLRTGLSDAQLRAAVSGARFTVFPSLHEGYGLPAAESLALGTPVITTSYGSTAEIAQDGGAITVDPRDDAALAAAMERLLTSDEDIDRLRAQIRARRERSWQDYADELWDTIVRPVLRDLSGTTDVEGHS